MVEWWLKTLLVGASGGLLGGMLGVGGGIIMVPLLMGLMNLEIHNAKATSLAVILFVAVSGTLEHQRQGRVNWPMVLAAGLAAIVFSALGAYLSERVPRDVLLRIFAILLIVTGVKYLLPAKKAAPPAEAPVTEPAPATQG